MATIIEDKNHRPCQNGDKVRIQGVTGIQTVYKTYKDGFEIIAGYNKITKVVSIHRFSWDLYVGDERAPKPRVFSNKPSKSQMLKKLFKYSDYDPKREIKFHQLYKIPTI